MVEKKHTEFRMWVHNLWIQNWEERLTFGQQPVDIKHYWNEYKYWLRREYRHQQRKQLQEQDYQRRHGRWS